MGNPTTNLGGTLTFILAGGEGSRLRPLTDERPKPFVPFGGIFRIIDFTLSNCLNSGLRRLYLLTQYKHEALHRYVREGWGALWNEFRLNRGEFLVCLPPASGKRYRGTADAVLQNIELIRRERPEFVLILSGDHIYHMDYRELVERHADSGAGLTIAAVEQPAEEASRFGVLEVEPDGRAAGFEEKPALPRARSGNPGKVLVSMGVYVFNTAVLLRAIEEGAPFLDRTYDFGKHVFPALINSVPVHAYPLRDRASGAPRYWRDIGTIDSYYEASMDLTQNKPLFDPYSNEDWPARIGKNPGLTREFVFSEPQENTNSRVRPGFFPPCRPSARVRGRVLNSVVSSGVHVAVDASVEHSVLMRGVTIGNGARVRKAIVEEDVEIPAGVEIGYSPADCGRYFVTRSGIVVVTRHVVETRPARAATVATA